MEKSNATPITSMTKFLIGCIRQEFKNRADD